MTDNLNKGRRSAMIAALYLGALPLITRAKGALSESVEWELAQGLTAGFSDLESARSVGLAYLAEHPSERSLGTLLNGIFSGDTPRTPAPAKELKHDLSSFIRSRTHDDFSCGNTVVVQGWILSRTEARVYALTALI